MEHIDLKPWDDSDPLNRIDDEPDESEAWKNKPHLDATKALYEQWRQVVYLINSILPEGLDEHEGEDEDPELRLMRQGVGQLVTDMLLVAVKIRTARRAPYIQKMENAAMIRNAAQDVALGLWSLQTDNDNPELPAEGLDESHRLVIRAEIDKFRELFKAWLATFEKDDLEDEWGLFV